MIEAIAAAAKSVAEAAGAAKEALSGAAVREVGAGRAASEAGAGCFRVGGDFRSILAALQIDPVALSAETLGVGGSGAEAIEHVALEDSKGEVRHQLSSEEAAHYERIGLTPQEVNGRECLVRDDIDWDQKDPYGQTNLERAEQGLAPLDQEGRPYELHHVQQQSEGMLAELTRDEHRAAGIDRVLHDPGKTSEIDRAEFDKTRADHWRARAAEAT